MEVTSLVSKKMLVNLVEGSVVTDVMSDLILACNLSDDDMVKASGKLNLLDRMLPRLKADGHRVLLFSQFTSMLDILEDFCQLRGFEYVRLDGWVLKLLCCKL